ncbi:hypothetical protein BGX38DRAFT_619908 [Terfezia claveryi]|nr:hypothetical protein BGX38DRAFT_619908 [Terfezia claveryi]
MWLRGSGSGGCCQLWMRWLWVPGNWHPGLEWWVALVELARVVFPLFLRHVCSRLAVVWCGSYNFPDWWCRPGVVALAES